jgi:hypothetical protein
MVCGSVQNISGTLQMISWSTQIVCETMQPASGNFQNVYGTVQILYGSSQNVYGTVQNIFGTTRNVLRSAQLTSWISIIISGIYLKCNVISTPLLFFSPLHTRVSSRLIRNINNKIIHLHRYKIFICAGEINQITIINNFPKGVIYYANT